MASEGEDYDTKCVEGRHRENVPGRVIRHTVGSAVNDGEQP